MIQDDLCCGPSLIMHSDDGSGPGSLDVRLACQEKESKEFLVAKVHQLEGLLKRAQEECSSLR